MTEMQRTATLERIQSVPQETPKKTSVLSRFTRRHLYGLVAAGGLAFLAGCDSGAEPQAPQSAVQMQGREFILFYDRATCEKMAKDHGETVVEFTDPNGKQIFLFASDAEQLKKFAEEEMQKEKASPVGSMRVYGTKKECQDATGKACGEVRGQNGAVAYAPTETQQDKEKKEKEKPVAVRSGGHTHFFPYHIYSNAYNPYYSGASSNWNRTMPMHMSAPHSESPAAHGIVSHGATSPARTPIAVRTAPAGKVGGSFSPSVGRGGFGGGHGGGHASAGS